MTTATQYEAIEKHGRNLLAIFPEATENDPVKLCKKLRRLEAKAYAISLQACNGPNFADGEEDTRTDDVLKKVNKLLGNVREYQPKTGAKCGCRRGIQRDNCANCEGTGQVVDFAAIRAQRDRIVPVFVNKDARGYALKIDDEWMRAHPGVWLHSDWGGYGILAPEIDKNGRMDCLGRVRRQPFTTSIEGIKP